MTPNKFVPQNPDNRAPISPAQLHIRSKSDPQQASLDSLQGPSMQLNHTQTQMMGNSGQQHSHLTSMQGPNMHINPEQLQTRGNSDFERS